MKKIIMMSALWVGLWGNASVAADIPAGGLYPVTLKEVEGAVSQALQEKGAGEVVHAYIVGKRTTVMYNTTKPATLEIKTLDFTSSNGKWSANILFVAGQEVLSAVPLSGRYDEMVNVPVMKKPLHAGDTIQKDNITLQAFAKQRVRQDTITDMAALVGKAPRRAISANRPIRADEIQNPNVLAKGAVVEMQYNTPYMNIRTLGEAMDAGAVGDVIAVRNQASRKIVQAVVTGSGEVRVTPLADELASVATPLAPAAHATIPEPSVEEDPYNEKL